MKTESDDAAGSYFMFWSWRHTDVGNVTLTGVVLRQNGHNLITSGLYAAKQLVDRLTPDAATPETRDGEPPVPTTGGLTARYPSRSAR
jgi:hypothetical protein